MTRMYPAFIEDGSPPGEVKVFRRLAEIEDDWVAIHALDVAPSNDNKRTEIDFLVLIPDVGLLCVEIKSHRHITFDGQQWHPESITRSPFRQAEDAKHALIRRFKKIRKIAEGTRLPLPIGKVCIFSESAFDVSNCISVNPTELIDARQLDQLTTWQSFRDKLKSSLLSALRNDSIQPLKTPLTAIDIEQILQECLPIQKRKARSAEELEAAERNIQGMLREQQRPVLRLSELNPRVLVTGPAGTGKTLIAIELAKRFAEKGNRVGLFCFNRLLGDWLGEQLEGRPSVSAGTVYTLLSRMTGVTVDGSKSTDPNYWSVELPEAYLERMTSPDFAEDYSFDVLLVDESQDLIPRDMLWQCVMQLARGGDQGRWLVFGDFSNQAVAGGDNLKEKVEALKNSARPAHWELRENCRNLSLIGKTAIYLLGAEGNVYDGYLRHGENPEYRKYLPYADADEQERNVLQEVAALRAEGLGPEDIILLSFCSEEKSVGRRLNRTGQRFCPAGNPVRGSVSFANINAFKGMDRKAVILTDIENLYEAEHERARLFVGATRATDRLRISLAKSVAERL